MKWIWIRCIVASFIGSTACMAVPATLVKDGKNSLPIVLPEKSSNADQLAARELSHYLKKISGAEHKVMTASDSLPSGPKIYIGKIPDKMTLASDERLIKTENGSLYLSGDGYEGNLAAVYRFLNDDLGCRWWDAFGDETVPAKKTISVDKNRKWKEILPYRSLMTFFHTKPGTHQFYARNGQNLLLGQGAFPANRIVPVGKGNHSLHKFVPPSQYFKEKPEFFSQNTAGKRITSWQLCFSNAELRQTLTENIIKFCRDKVNRAAEKGQECWIEVSVMDVTGPFCLCDGCKKLAEKYQTPGGAFFEYMTELGPAVKESLPNAKIASLLYRKEQTEKPPKGLRMPENFIGIFAPIDDNIFAPLNHASNHETLEHLRQWCKQTKNIWVWYYPDTYGMFGPYSALRRSIEDLRLMKEAGISGTFYEHDVTTPNSDNFADLQNYVLLKLFGGAENAEKLIQEFMKHYYGPAGELMHRYFNQLEDFREKAVRSGVVGYYACSPLQLGYFSSTNLEKWSCMFDRMEEMVKQDAERFFRVRLVRRQLDELLLKKWDTFAAESAYAKTVSPKVLKDRCIETLRGIEKKRRPDVPQRSAISGLESFTVQNIPAELAGVDPKRIRQIFLAGDIKDAAAALGTAAGHSDLVKFPYGLYVNDYRSHVSKNGIQPKWTLLKNHFLQKGDVKPDTYKLYKIGTFPITNATRVSTTTNAFFFKDIGLLFSEKEPKTAWDVYLSLKFEGPSIPGSKVAKDRVLCDRIVLVRP